MYNFFQIANRLNVSSRDVNNVIIWGNHSSTQFPDVSKAVVNLNGKVQPVPEAVKDDQWIKNEFISVSTSMYDGDSQED